MEHYPALMKYGIVSAVPLTKSKVSICCGIAAIVSFQIFTPGPAINVVPVDVPEQGQRTLSRNWAIESNAVPVIRCGFALPRYQFPEGERIEILNNGVRLLYPLMRHAVFVDQKTFEKPALRCGIANVARTIGCRQVVAYALKGESRRLSLYDRRH
jgi:hypothetical protein